MKVKEFGMEIARMIYVERLSIKETVEYMFCKYPKANKAWLAEQVQVVVNNPKIYKNMANQ